MFKECIYTIKLLTHEQFMQFESKLTELLPNEWVDFADPVTGYPSKSQRGGMTYSDVDANELLLR